jgi:hypothetical protein
MANEARRMEGLPLDYASALKVKDVRKSQGRLPLGTGSLGKFSISFAGADTMGKRAVTD